MATKNITHFAPGRIIVISLVTTVVLGALLLWLPACRTCAIPFIDLLFTAASATCVTGLLTIPLSHFTPLGHSIIMMLIQIGGLGLITMTIFIISIFVHLGLTTQLLAGQVLELESWKNIRSLLFFIIVFTLLLELCGALFTFFAIYTDFSVSQALFFALFHGISSFCNAGFTLFADGMKTYSNNALLLTTTTVLMLSGGLGFITWHELLEYVKAKLYKKRKFLSLYTKIIISMTSSIIIIVGLLYWILERYNAFISMNVSDTFFNTLFNTIASRSTGFVTVNPMELHIATLFMVLIVAFIGSAPGSTGSGIKTTTFAIFLATIRTAILGHSSVQIKERRIARDQVYKALAIISLSLGWVMVTIFCLLITEISWEFFDIFFETISAFATLGVSTGITPFLSLTGKLFIIITMMIGRIGPLTIVLALRKRKETHEYEYPEERVMLG